MIETTQYDLRKTNAVVRVVHDRHRDNPDDIGMRLIFTQQDSEGDGEELVIRLTNDQFQGIIDLEGGGEPLLPVL